MAKSSRPRDVDTANTLPPLKVPRRVRWTDDEKQAIIDGVNRFGEGKWNAIFKFHHEVFKVNNRDCMGIRDQFKTLKKNGQADKMLSAAKDCLSEGDNPPDIPRDIPRDNPQARIADEPTPSTRSAPITASMHARTPSMPVRTAATRNSTGRKDSWSRADVLKLIDAVLKFGRDWKTIADNACFSVPYNTLQLNNKWKSLKKWGVRYRVGQLSAEDARLYEQVAVADKKPFALREQDEVRVRDWIEANRLGHPPQALPLAMAADMKSIKKPKCTYKGVTWEEKMSMWRMRLTHNSNNIASGYFRSADDAARAYNAALKSALEHGIKFKYVKRFNVIEADKVLTDAHGNNEVAAAPAQLPVPALAALPPAEVKLMEQHETTHDLECPSDPDSDDVDIPDLGLGMYDSDDADESDSDSDAKGDGGHDRSTR